jgi:hypothetical protein
MKHVADPGPVNLAAVQRAAAQGQFLNEHIDCIVPWRFPPQLHIQRHFARLLRSWGEANVRQPTAASTQ